MRICFLPDQTGEDKLSGSSIIVRLNMPVVVGGTKGFGVFPTFPENKNKFFSTVKNLYCTKWSVGILVLR